jgi:TPR repeat protein
MADLDGQDAARDKCLGRVHFNRAQFREAIARWTHNGPLDDTDDLLLDLAWARQASGDSAGAASDASRFVHASLKAGSLTAKDAAFATLIIDRLGKPVWPALLAYAAATEGGPWPRPILGFLTGQLNEQALLLAAAQYGPDKRDLALNDATFYIGERLRQAGKSTQARDAWRWYLANGILSSREHVLALQGRFQIEFSDPDLVAEQVLLSAKSPDYKAAKALLLQAAARGVGDAESELGFLAEHGQGGPANFIEAAQWYARGAANGNPNAMYHLALLYQKGKGVAADQARADALLASAAAAGHNEAARDLGRRYLYGGTGVQRDEKQALRYLLMAAKLGNDDAQTLLSHMYRDAIGTDKDLVHALYWASRSMEQGNLDGMAQVAYMLFHGYGVAQDQAKALTMWRKAAEGGSSAAQAQLGDAYYHGTGVEKNLAQALTFSMQQQPKAICMRSNAPDTSTCTATARPKIP